MCLRSFTLFELYRRNALLSPEAPAVIWPGGSCSFAELLDLSGRLAEGLRLLGAGPGDRVAVLAQNCPHFFPLFGAASALGSVLVLVNRRLGAEEILHCLEDTGASLLLTDAQGQEAARDLLSRSSSLQQVAQLDPHDSDLAAGFGQLLGPQLQAPTRQNGDDPFAIIHTAAVMGQPRGAVLSQHNLLAANLQLMADLQLTPEDVYLNILPLFHIMGINLGLAVMQAGGANVVLPRFEAQAALELMARHQVSLLGTFPPILSNLLAALEESGMELPSLRHVMGLDQPEIIQAWQDRSRSRFWAMYGQTETSGLMSMALFDDCPGSAGRPGPLVDLKIVDEFDRPQPQGTKGEIVIRGPLVFQGYWQQEELNALTFRENWHHTGDLGWIDHRGFLHFLGRKAEKDLIKSGGENVFPVEVEKAILEHPKVQSVCVIGVPDPTWGEGIKAVCVLDPGSSLQDVELIDFVSHRIARYKKPRIVEFVTGLPLLEDGTIDRAQVKERHGGGSG